ncbi:MAG: S8 family serine peptidase [Acidobacteria bacterium]|nr:S8 family serine peptidase [Acidobacteriota bacterium]MCI0722237.1 S8 family serine peptidase [Acidobacteriota bacterium]
MAAREYQFVHPTHGRCKRDETKAAIRWADGTPERSKKELLGRLRLVLSVTALPRGIGKGQRNVTEVNQTSGISWVESAGKGPLTQSKLREAEKSPLVQWVGQALRAEKAPEVEGLFTVNPKKLYLSAAAAAALGDLTIEMPGVSIDTVRGERLRGLVCLRLEMGNATDVADKLAAALSKKKIAVAGAIRFENIPFISPGATCECDTLDVGCRVAPKEVLPNDPLFPVSWGLRRINAPYAWNITQGDPSVVVAVIDQGVELGHPDLSLFPQSWNASTDTPDGSPTGNHGTACAGIVAATINNALGATGVAGECRIMAIATATWADIDIAESLYFAADNGASVVSMSFGVYASWGFWDFDLIRDALQYAYDKGLVLVAASGNENGAVARFPGSDSRTICVGGSNRDDQRKRIGDASSEAWWGASYGPDLDVVGPCLEIPTTDRLGGFGYSMTDYYDRFNGTSSATPHVAGLAGLILSLRPELTNETVREIIETTCDKISPALYNYALVATKPNGTWNDETGYGRINAERALLVACQYGKGKGEGPCDFPSICLPAIPKDCIAPAAPPWQPFDQCILFYEPRFVGDREIQIRIIYEHCLRLLGRQQGPLLFTTTLLPGETMRLFHYDRYRRVRSATQTLSAHTSFRQTVSALWQSRTTNRERRYQDFLVKVRSDDDANITVGGQLFPVEWEIDDPDTYVSDAQGMSLESVSETFQQIATSASQQVDAERSLVVSNFEEIDAQNTTSRTVTNHNHCRAVTYFVRRVLEVYELSTHVKEIDWRMRERERQRAFGQWRRPDNFENVPDNIRKLFVELLQRLPKPSTHVMVPMRITLPTDGALYEAELAHCSSCEPERRVEVELSLERTKSEVRKLCLEAELLALEVERRKALLAKGVLELESAFPARTLGPADERTTAHSMTKSGGT